MSNNISTGEGLPTLCETAAALAEGRTSSRALVEQALARIDDPAGEGRRVFISVHRTRAAAEAEISDRLIGLQRPRSALEGIPVSIKDLMDERGVVTTAGSTVLRDAAPAASDAPVAARLRAAGAIIIGRTNMSEFARSGIGLNPQYGTPANPWDRAARRIPGGSSSGAAVSVTDRMALAAVGSDTGGSVRIPAALCGITGFKPTQAAVSRQGVFPLSTSLDSIGPLAPSVACCITMHTIMADRALPPIAPLPLAGMRLAVARARLCENLDADVSAAFAAALTKLSAAGARITEVDFPALVRTPPLKSMRVLSLPEAYAAHRPLLHRHAEYDQSLVGDLLTAGSISAADYVDMLRLRASIKAQVAEEFRDYDAVLSPTVPCIAPVIATMEAARDLGGRMGRNTFVINFIDGCALSIPCHAPGSAPVGLMVSGAGGADEAVLRVGLAIEAAL